MPFVDTRLIEKYERLPGWRGCIYESPNMTRHGISPLGAEIQERHHVQEEVWQALEGELEVRISGERRRAGPRIAAIVQADTLH